MIKYKDIIELSSNSLKRRCLSHKNSRVLSTKQNILVESEKFENGIENIQENIQDQYIFDDDNYSELTDEDTSDQDSENVLDFLRKWHIENNCTSKATNQLLKFLKANGFPHLPSDTRSLVQTPISRDVIPMSQGQYIHFGLRQGLANMLDGSDLDELPDELELDFNVDGVPIYKSSKNTFWPILSRVFNIDYHNIFVVGIYCGKTKPKCFKEFLRPLVDDMKSTLNDFIY